MRYPKLRELVEAIKALVRGPYTSSFPFKPHIPEKRYRGKPTYYEDQCVGCKACSEVCPVGCIKTKDDTETKIPMRRLDLHYDSCIFCGQCQASCITKEGIKLSNKFEDLSVFDRSEAVESVEKPLLLCEACGCIVGAKDHLLWVAKKLGALGYSSPTSYLSALQELRLAHLDVEKVDSLTRQDRIKILCPKCRREITLNT
ncbi:MAG: 4Fe-4S dicluster domain-containing protein [Candidatus Omnitrophota bacterium]|nr:4Fe-4S dicluster domain-containing protein [Candidatus Omnitrophota bacterium]